MGRTPNEDFQRLLRMEMQFGAYCPACATPLVTQTVSIIGRQIQQQVCPQGHGHMSSIGLGDGPALLFLMSEKLQGQLREE